MRFPHIYPDPESRALRAALAGFTGVPQDYLLAGAGADELIDLLLRVLLEPGDRVAANRVQAAFAPFSRELRALARDIGNDLGCGAFLKTLRRTRVGPYAIDQSLTVEQFVERLTD